MHKIAKAAACTLWHVGTNESLTGTIEPNRISRLYVLWHTMTVVAIGTETTPIMWKISAIMRSRECDRHSAVFIATESAKTRT